MSQHSVHPGSYLTPGRRSFRALTSACICSRWNISTLWGKDGIFQGESRDFTCQSKKSLRRTSPEVLISRSGSGELLVYRHLSSSHSDTSLKDRHSLLDPFPYLMDVAQIRSKGFYVNPELQIKTGWWSWTTASHQLASDRHCCLLHRLFQMLFQPPEHPTPCSLKHNSGGSRLWGLPSGAGSRV